MQRARIGSAVNSVKELITIVTGLTVTSAILALVTRADLASVRSINDVSLSEFGYFALLMAVLIRFYHGNMMLLDQMYGGAEEKGSPRNRNLALDFLVIFTLSVILAMMSFHLNQPNEFSSLFIVVLVIDVLWFLGSMPTDEDEAEPSARKAAKETQKKWALNNVFHLILLFGLQNFSDQFTALGYTWIAAGIVLSNTLIDFVFNRDFYFPKTMPIQDKPE